MLGALLQESPEYLDWSRAVQPVLNCLLERNRIKRLIVCRVVDLPALNAIALPHKTIVLSQLLVEFCRNQRDQMAFVLGHELAHIHLGHARERNVANGIMTVAPLANPLLGVGLGMFFDRAYSREQEFEADHWAVRFAARAGYVPSASIALLQRLGGGEAPNNLVSQLLGTHPPLTERLQHLREAILRCNDRALP
jgi:Zn-dependent protease with chaperone function